MTEEQFSAFICTWIVQNIEGAKSNNLYTVLLKEKTFIPVPLLVADLASAVARTKTPSSKDRDLKMTEPELYTLIKKVYKEWDWETEPDFLRFLAGELKTALEGKSAS